MSETSSEYLQRGITLASERHFREAVAEFDKAIEHDPNLLEAYLQRARACLESGDIDAAIEGYSVAIEVDPESAEAYWGHATALLAKGDFDKAAEVTPNLRVTALTVVGVDLINATSLCPSLKPDVGSLYDWAINLHPGVVELHRARARARQKDGDISEAIEDYTKALELAPEDATAWLGFGDLHLESGNAQAAIAHYDKAIQFAPKWSHAYECRAKALLAVGDLEGVKCNLAKILELDAHGNVSLCTHEILQNTMHAHPGWGWSYYFRGLLRLQGGDTDGAVADFAKAMQLDISLKSTVEPFYKEAFERNPKSPEQFIERAEARIKDHHSRHLAIADLDKALELGVDPYRVNMLRAETRRLGDTKTIIEDYTRAIESNPTSTAAYQSRSWNWFCEGKYHEAIADCTRWLELDAHSSRAYNMRGVANGRLERIDSAIADLTRAIELDPHWMGAYTNRANLRARKGDLDGAIADYARAIDLGKELDRLHMERGILRGQHGDIEGAITDLSKAIELSPTWYQCYFLRGKMRLAKADHKGAEEDFKRAVESEKSKYPNRPDTATVESLLERAREELERPHHESNGWRC